MGWDVTSAPEADVGTDLYVLVIDSRLFDAGLLIGAQVKTGDSYFSEAGRDDSGEITGWWFRDDDREHIDSWLAHSLPHLIVLHDEEAGKSYWAHITTGSVVSTGKGAKVFVPAQNTFREENRVALLEIAATQRKTPSWEGSSWSGASDLLPKDVLRHALLVPRVVARHRNTPADTPVTAEEVVALLVEGRIEDVGRLTAGRDDVPTLEAATTSPNWVWRFVAAFATRVTAGTVDRLTPLIRDAPNASSRAAVTAVAAAGLLDMARPHEALALLDEVLDRDDNSPVDHAWLTSQRARACWEVGRVDDAKLNAIEVQEVRGTHAHDLTATAIAGSAALVVFSLSNWGLDDVKKVIVGSDTPAVWWRAQRVATGSIAAIEREFRVRVRRRVIWAVESEDTANNRLFTAALLASHLGDHREWGTMTSLNAKQALLKTGRRTDPDVVSRLLTEIRLAGDDKAMDLAVRELVANGPAAAVSLAADGIDLARCTRTTCGPTLTLLRRGGDVLDETTASDAAQWLLTTLADPSSFIEGTRPQFLVVSRLVDTLAGILSAARDIDRRAAAELVVDLDAQEDQVAAISFARLVRALGSSVWTADLSARAADVASKHHDDLRLALLSVAAPHHDNVRQQLKAEAGDGSISALDAVGDLRDLPADVVVSLVEKLAAQIESQIEEAHQNRYSHWGHDAGRILAMLNVHHRDSARWELLLTWLEDRRVPLQAKLGACDVLGRLVAQLDPGIRERVGEIASAIVNYPDTFVDMLGERMPGGRGAAAELAAAATGDQTLTRSLVNRLLAGDADLRSWACHVAVRLDPPVAAAVLASLTHDSDPEVRATAARCLVQIMAAGSADTLALEALRQAIADPGTLVVRHIARALINSPRTDVTVDLRGELASHRSAAVRAAIAKYL